MKTISTLLIRYTTPISFDEIRFLRGAIIATVPPDAVLFHNHEGSGFRYSYPLVQYKRIGGCAAVLFVDGGTNLTASLAQDFGGRAMLGRREVDIGVDKVDAATTTMQVWNNDFVYTLRKYLPLNQTNYAEYEAMDSMVDRCRKLEAVLTGNILSFAKGVGVHFDQNIRVSIVDMSQPTDYRFKGITMKGFDLKFKTNVSLPSYIGLGKGVSLGFGVIKRMKQE